MRKPILCPPGPGLKGSPFPPPPPDPPDEHAFTHNGDRYVYRGVSTPAEPTTQPTRQPPPKSPTP